MKTSELLKKLGAELGFEPTLKDLANICGHPSEQTIYGRKKRDSIFPDDDIEKIEAHYGVSLRGGDNNSLEIEYVNIHPSCGHGTTLLSDAEVTPVRIGKELIKDVWKIENPQNLICIKASGDSMQPLIYDDDILLVNTARTDFHNGGIFLLTINNDWYVKRLRLRVTGELDIISENSKYPIETLQPNTSIEIQVKGRVLKNLSRGL